MRAIVQDDLVVAIVDGDIGGGLAMPPDLIGLPLGRLRVLDGAVIDAATITAWHIDAAGQKRLDGGDDRQPLTCAWDAVLVRDGGSWRVRTTADELIAYANARQWAIATGGAAVDIGGGQSMTIPTDTTTQGLLAGKILRLSKPNPPATVTWQTSPTTFVTLPAAVVEAIGVAVDAHVQATFDTLEIVLADIADGTIATTAEIDAAFA